MALAETGEDVVLYCDSCEYAANQERAESILEEFEQDTEQRPMQEVFGEGLIGVEPLAEFLKIPVWKTTKTLLFEADGELVGVMVRGDCDVNEIKVQNHLDCKELRLASAERIAEITGAEVGYAGPIGLPDGVKILADTYTDKRVNFECGANKTNYHNIDVNFERDLPVPAFADFKLAKAGDGCPRCESGKLLQTKGIEVGHIFQLGTKYSIALKAMYLDSAGESQPMVMGCYGIGVSRMAAAVVEQSHDEHGIIWPPNIAPYQVHLIALNIENDSVRSAAEELYQSLNEIGIEVLYDDRDLRAGEKFSDADLIGIPLRLVVSKRTAKEGKLERKLRNSTESELLTREQVIAEVQNLYTGGS